jgi:hypothetical protein
MTNLATKESIVREADRLGPADLARVLEFMRALPDSRPKGVSGRELLERLPGTWDPEDAREMMEAIEEGCEQVDPDGW